VTYIAQAEWTYLIPSTHRLSRKQHEFVEQTNSSLLQNADYQVFDPEADVAALVWMMLIINLTTIVAFVAAMVGVVLRLPLLRFLRARGKTGSKTYDVVQLWDRVVN
jgi:K+-transporting ATPase A subunit